MKIIKDGNHYLNAKRIYDKANEGCGRCPCCGLFSRTTVEVIDKSFEYPGLSGRFEEYGTYEYDAYSPDRKERVVKMVAREYTCHYCGAVWESETYPAAVEEIVNGEEPGSTH